MTKKKKDKDKSQELDLGLFVCRREIEERDGRTENDSLLPLQPFHFFLSSTGLISAIQREKKKVYFAVVISQKSVEEMNEIFLQRK